MNEQSRLPIAMFDSGVGGLTVFRAIREMLPDEDLLYLGDTARVPYGTKSPDTIIRYTLMAAGKLLERGAKMLVIACNTATSAALPVLQRELAPLPVLGVIRPGALAAAQATVNGRIAVIGTEATIRGMAYQKAIGELKPDAQVVGRACTLFVPLAEEGWLSGPVAEAVAARYLGDIFTQSPDAPDTLLLGCTHFPLLQETLQKTVGDHVKIVDSARATAIFVRDKLKEMGLSRKASQPPRYKFLITDNPERFGATAEIFLNSFFREHAMPDVELVEL